MRHQQTLKMLKIQEPSDGLLNVEKSIIQEMFNKSIDELYKTLPTHRMKAVMALHFEVGYDQETLARIFAVSQEQIALEVRNIRNILKGGNFVPKNKNK